MFWPRMAAQITDVVLNCHTCSTHQRRNTKEPLLSHPTLSHPWERIAADLCEVNVQHYYVMVDYYSNFIEVDCLSETTSEKTLNAASVSLPVMGFQIHLSLTMDHSSLVTSFATSLRTTNLNITPAAPTTPSQWESRKGSANSQEPAAKIHVRTERFSASLVGLQKYSHK